MNDLDLVANLELDGLITVNCNWSEICTYRNNLFKDEKEEKK